jgi:hypothetical protein
MADAGSYPARRRGSTEPLPPSPLLRPEKRLDAALLAVVRSTKLADNILPGVPFH